METDPGTPQGSPPPQTPPPQASQIPHDDIPPRRQGRRHIHQTTPTPTGRDYVAPGVPPHPQHQEFVSIPHVLSRIIEDVSRFEQHLQEEAYATEEAFVYKGENRILQTNETAHWNFIHGAQPHQFRYTSYFFKNDIGTYMHHLNHRVLRTQTECHICLEGSDSQERYYAPACGHPICFICKHEKIKRNDFTCGVCRYQIPIYYHVHRVFFNVPE